MRQVLCGGCQKPLTRGMAESVVDTVGEVYQERIGWRCLNPNCNYYTSIIEVNKQPRRSFINRIFPRELLPGSAT